MVTISRRRQRGGAGQTRAFRQPSQRLFSIVFVRWLDEHTLNPNGPTLKNLSVRLTLL
ncbi:hypothetical protein M8756_15575 [Lutimaribacter sp. EGI FJ00015]|nr:hypothetical protein [Lutimaribacter sp. EGI FJ00015]MCO0637410.1 hypothetical protein [Lutimaribacter sp. EGI FJ00014]